MGRVMDINTLKVGSRVEVEFISESRTEFSGIKFNGFGVVEHLEDGRVMGRLDSGNPFMCFPSDCKIVEGNAE
jgi:hypothetical protein